MISHSYYSAKYTIRLSEKRKMKSSDSKEFQDLH